MDMAVLGMARRVSSWPWLKFPEMLQRVLQEINICWVGMILPSGKIRGHLHTGETLRPHLRRRKPCHELNVERVQVRDVRSMAYISPILREPDHLQYSSNT